LGGLELHEHLTIPTLRIKNSLILGERGIVNHSGIGGRIIGGIITSSTSNLDLRLYVDTGTRRYLAIDSVISDHKYHKVGLRVTGDHAGFSLVSLFGDKENTFTGDVEVAGEKTLLDLKKAANIIAIHSNIRITQKSELRIFRSNNIARSSTVTLSNGTFTLVSGNTDSRAPISQSLKELYIDKDGGRVHFDKGTTAGVSKHLYLDDLIIKDGSFLQVTHWLYGEDFLLVRKDSKHLANSLKKIRFVGYDPNAIHLEEFNKDYWLISGAPEPATYGAILSTFGLSVFIFAKRNRNRANTLPGALKIPRILPLRLGELHRGKECVEASRE